MWPSCHARTEGLSSTEADPPHKAWTPSSCPCTNCSQQDSKLSQGPSNSQNLEADLNCSPVYVTNWWCWLESTAAEWCVARCACGLSPTWFIKCKRCNEPVLVGLARLSLHPQQENGWTDPRIDCSPPPSFQPYRSVNVQHAAPSLGGLKNLKEGGFTELKLQSGWETFTDSSQEQLWFESAYYDHWM